MCKPHIDNTADELPVADTSNVYCRILLDVLQGHGVKDAIVSPGSRNTPLLISLHSRKQIATHVVCDERNAAFAALGMAMIYRRPLILCCTSGTALYNYAPAVAEAFHQHIPLIVISADRPFEWIDQYDSQTLHQPGALDKIVKKSFDIPVMDSSPDMEWYVNRIANEAFNLASSGLPGPVHINIQLAPPLQDRITLRRTAPRLIKTLVPKPFFPPSMLDDLAEKIMNKKILVVAGFMQPDDQLNHALSLFCSLPGVVVAAETLSNLHLKNLCYEIDTLLGGLSSGEKENLKPDLVIQIGGAPVSRMIKDFCRSIPELEVWTLGDTELGADCLQGLSCHIQAPPEFFFKALFYKLRRSYSGIKNDISPALKDYTALWYELRKLQQEKKNSYIKSLGWCELKAFRTILSSLPGNYNLFLGNGTPVRYGQLFTSNLPHASYSNRGVSGIEGTTATAAGCAAAYNGPTLLISGDMAFSYAPEVLGLPFIPSRFKIIVINNKGGGIFRFIASTRNLDCRDELFCADPRVPVEAVALSHGWKYYLADSEASLNDLIIPFLADQEKSLLEIKVPEVYSADVLKQYMSIAYNSECKDE